MRFTLLAILVPTILVSQTSFAADDDPRMEAPTDCTFISDHDRTQQKYVQILPRNLPEPTDVLIALHGHGSDRWQFVREPRDECRAARDAAAENKMIFITPDYRASTSWMGPAAEADMCQIIDILKKNYRVKRVILCGGSMGGTGALTFTARHPELIQGVVSLNGTANLVDYDRFQDAIAASFGGTKQQVPLQYRERSAEFFPEKFTMPIAATTGGKDDIVPPDSILRLLKNIEKHNPNVLSIHRPNGDHSSNYEDSRAALDFVISR